MSTEKIWRSVEELPVVGEPLVTEVPVTSNHHVQG